MRWTPATQRAADGTPLTETYDVERFVAEGAREFATRGLWEQELVGRSERFGRVANRAARVGPRDARSTTTRRSGRARWRIGASQRIVESSGQVPRNADGKTVGVGNMTRQAEQVFENLEAALNAHAVGHI